MRNNNGLPTSVSLGDVLATCPNDIRSLFADHFSTVYENGLNNSASFEASLSFTPLNVLNVEFVSVSTASVLRALGNLKLSFVQSPDGIPAAFLFHCREALALPVSFLFNLSLSTATFPNILNKHG